MSNAIKIHQFPPETWPLTAAKFIQNKIDAILIEQAECSVMLTGGRTAEKVYSSWENSPMFQRLRNIRFYYGDERCVTSDSPDSNYGMTLRTLFRRGLPPQSAIHPIIANLEDCRDVANRYAKLLPYKLDILLLSIGDDGHIASLFPKSIALKEKKSTIVCVASPKPPLQRITITPVIIRRAKSVIVFAAGAEKVLIFERLLKSPNNITELPARLVLNADWLMYAREYTTD